MWFRRLLSFVIIQSPIGNHKYMADGIGNQRIALPPHQYGFFKNALILDAISYSLMVVPNLPNFAIFENFVQPFS